VAAAPAAVPAEPQVVLTSENEVILETTRGGLARNEDGEIARTYTGAPPEACPT
jgi:hypothetical protein